MTKLLELSDFSAGYGENSIIINKINLSVSEGETIGIVGKNGCGKSTLAKSIVGLTPFRSGNICFRGQSISNLPSDSMQSLGISIMQQGGRVFPNMSVWENFQLAAQHIAAEDVKEKIIEMIPLFHDPNNGKLRRSADKLSGGERHQLALAMTLAAARDMVILDEPSAGLMPSAVNVLYEILNKVKVTFNSTILLIEQNAKLAEDFASRLAFMENGKIAYQGNDIEIVEKLMYK